MSAEASPAVLIGKKLVTNPAALREKMLTETASQWDHRQPAAMSTSATCSTIGEVRTPAPGLSGAENVTATPSQGPGMTLPRMARDA